MYNFDFYDANMCLRLKRRKGCLGGKELTYALYAYPTRDGAVAYAVTVTDMKQSFAVRCIETYEDAETVFSLISENEIDICSLDDVVDDYFYEKKHTTYSDVPLESSNIMC